MFRRYTSSLVRLDRLPDVYPPPIPVSSSLPSTDSSCAFSALTSKTPAEITKYSADSVAVTDRYDAEALQSLMNPPEPDVYEGPLGSEDHLQWLNAMKEE